MKRHLTYIIAAVIAISCTKQQEETVPCIFRNTTVAEFNAQAADGNYYYYLSGTVAQIVDAEQSCFILDDGTGQVEVRGLWKSIHGKRIRNMGGYKEGDEICITALKDKFAGQPYAKNACVVNPEDAKVWVTPTSAEIPSEGGTVKVEVYTDEVFSLAVSESWVEVAGTEGNVVTLSVKANESIFRRFAYLNVRTADAVVRVKLTQQEYVPQLVKIADALTADYAHVEGSVLSVVEDGYLLADGSGAIFVQTSKFNGVYEGAGLSVTGSVVTEDYMTRIIPDLTKAVTSAGAPSSGPREMGPEEIDRIIADASAKDGGTAGNLRYEFVSVSGTVVYIDGKTRLVSDGKTLNIEPYKAGDALNFDDLNGHTLKLDGYIVSLSGGVLKMIVTGYEDIPVESAITVDGDYSDWEQFEDLVPGHDMSASHNLKPVVKLHCENGYVYGYVRVDKSEENGGFPKTDEHQYLLKIAGRFYVWIDNDDVTEGQGGGWLFNPQRYDNVIAYRITKTSGGWDGWSTVQPRANEYYGQCIVGNSHTKDESNHENVGYMATTADGDILEGEFSFLAAKVGLFGKETAVIGLEIGWDNGFNTGSASLGKEGYEIILN